MTHHDVPLHRHGHRQPRRHAHRHTEDKVRVRIQVAIRPVAHHVVRPQKQNSAKVEQVVDELDGVGNGQGRQKGVGGGPHVPVGHHQQGQEVAHETGDADARVQDEACDELSRLVELVELLIVWLSGGVLAPVHAGVERAVDVDAVVA